MLRTFSNDNTGRRPTAPVISALLSPCRRYPASLTALSGSFASALLLVPTEASADKVAELDGALLACCAEARRIDHRAGLAMAVIEAMDEDDADLVPTLEAAHPLFFAYEDTVSRAAQLRARTPEGLRAKAALLLLHLGAEQDPAELAASLARDVAGRA